MITKDKFMKLEARIMVTMCKYQLCIYQNERDAKIELHCAKATEPDFHPFPRKERLQL